MPDTERRKAWMSLLAKAPEPALMTLWSDYGAAPEFDWLRAPEVGGVMVRGRLGGTGAPFNLGEMTVTRCTLALKDGAVGHGYIQGRSKAKAEVAALIDALMQTPAAADVQGRVLAPLGNLIHDQNESRAAKAAATKVDFFTMVRGENA
ncbi:MAG: phosphonate C-P lyase system protein PhnG [Pseudomonadota bacterium]